MTNHVESQIVGAKSLSKTQVPKVVIPEKIKLDLNSGSNLMYKEIEMFWEKVKILSRKEQREINNRQKYFITDGKLFKNQVIVEPTI